VRGASNDRKDARAGLLKLSTGRAGLVVGDAVERAVQAALSSPATDRHRQSGFGSQTHFCCLRLVFQARNDARAAADFPKVASTGRRICLQRPRLDAPLLLRFCRGPR
jgi:hypothetical protein